MKILVYRTSGNTPPTKTCYKDGEVTYKYDTEPLYYEDIYTMEELVDFVKENGSVIFGKLLFPERYGLPDGTLKLEIYDDYRE